MTCSMNLREQLIEIREQLIEAGANAIYECGFDVVEVRDWGGESIADPARYLTDLAFDGFLDALADRDKAEEDA